MRVCVGGWYVCGVCVGGGWCVCVMCGVYVGSVCVCVCGVCLCVKSL